MEHPRGQVCVGGGGILAASSSPDAQARPELPPAPPYPPLRRAGACLTARVPRLVLEQAQLRAGCEARSWKTSSSAFPHLPEPGPGRVGFHWALSKASWPGPASLCAQHCPGSQTSAGQGRVTRPGYLLKWLLKLQSPLESC